LSSFAVLGNGLQSATQNATARISSNGVFISDLELLNTHLVGIETGWTASVIKQKSLMEIPIQLDPQIPDHESWKNMLEQRSVAVVDATGQKAPFRLIKAPEDEYEVVETARQNRVPVPANAEADIIVSVCDSIAHLIKYDFAKGLMNLASKDWFERSCSVLMVKGKDGKGERYSPGDRMVLEEDREAKFTFRLYVENKASLELYVYVYDLGPEWQVKNITGSTYEVVPPGTQLLSRKMKTTIPSHLRERYGCCDDVIKVFVTSHPTCFDSFELPKLGQPAQSIEVGAPDQGEGRDREENWAAANFFVHTQVSDSDRMSKQ
jgi:hypothetical protein